MNVSSDLDLNLTRDDKTRVIPRRESAEGSHQWCVGGREAFMSAHLSMWDPSLALEMTEDGRAHFTLL